MTTLAAFRAAAAASPPAAAVVLGSGLGRVADRVSPVAEIAFADVPGFPAATVHGHAGRVTLGTWGRATVLVFRGRTHFYEGHPWDRVTAGVRFAAELGAKTLVLTNAAGGIRDDLVPGGLMAVRGHLLLSGRDAWKAAAIDETPYCRHLLAKLAGVPAGVYAAVTGPCYETPAEIRAMRALGADAVGMSTAREAAAGAAAGMRVAAVSCVTNKAAGLAPGILDHADVLATASAPAARLAELVGILIGA